MLNIFNNGDFLVKNKLYKKFRNEYCEAVKLKFMKLYVCMLNKF